MKTLPWHRWGRQGRDLAHFSSTIANSICLNGIEVSRERPLFFSWGYQFLRRAMTTLFLVCARARMWVHIILLVVYCFVYVANLGQRSVCWPFIRVDNWPQYAFSLDEKDEGFFSYIIEGRSHTVIYIDRNNVGRSRTRLAPKSCSPWNFLLERVHLFFSWERCFTCKICGLTRRCLSTFMACNVGGFDAGLPTFETPSLNPNWTNEKIFKKSTKNWKNSWKIKKISNINQKIHVNNACSGFCICASFSVPNDENSLQH